jgi:transcription antitermination factor NusG
LIYSQPVTQRAKLYPVTDLSENIQSQTSSQWFAAYTKHQHEKVCADLLMRKSIEVYLPLYQSVRRWRDRKKTISLPLFPSYVFFRSVTGNRLEILNTPGVFFIVGNALGACPIAEEDIESMRLMTTSGLGAEPHPYLKSGERVRIKSGPLAGLQGLLVRVNNQSRVVVSVEPLKQAVSVEVGLGDIERERFSVHRCPQVSISPTERTKLAAHLRHGIRNSGTK